MECVLPPPCQHDGELHIAAASNMKRLGRLGLVDGDAQRIENGSICMWSEDPAGEPAAVFWLNGQTHEDRHFGEWTRPMPQLVYGNGLYVRPDLHGRGLGTELLCGALHHAADLGYRRSRAMIDMRNDSSLRLHRRLGYTVLTSLYGIKVGQRYVRWARRTDAE